MRAINLVTLLLVIVGGLNWGLVGLSTSTWSRPCSVTCRHCRGSSMCSSASPRCGRSCRSCAGSATARPTHSTPAKAPSEAHPRPARRIGLLSETRLRPTGPRCGAGCGRRSALPVSPRAISAPPPIGSRGFAPFVQCGRLSGQARQNEPVDRAVGSEPIGEHVGRAVQLVACGAGQSLAALSWTI